MKRYFIAAGVGSMVFAAALGSASMLSINPGVAQTGIETLRGDADGVTVTSYGFESDDSTSRFIRVGDVDSALEGEKLWAQIYDGSDVQLNKGSVVIDNDGEAVIHWTAPFPSIASIEKVRLTIE